MTRHAPYHSAMTRSFLSIDCITLRFVNPFPLLLEWTSPAAASARKAAVGAVRVPGLRTLLGIATLDQLGERGLAGTSIRRCEHSLGVGWEA